MKINKLSLCSLFVAMCFIGANIKFTASIALDSAPALIGTLLLGPSYGMVLGFFGHIISSLISGFTLTLPVHIIIALMMALTMYLYSISRTWLEKRTTKTVSIIGAGIVMFIFNCPLSLVALYPIINEMAIILFPVLAFASLCNLVIAEIIYVALPISWKRKFL